MTDNQKHRVMKFVNNGGGTITYRLALGAIMGITLYLIQSIGGHITGQLDSIAKNQNRMGNTLATQAQQVTDTARIASRNSDRIDDHEHRITILEVKVKP